MAERKNSEKRIATNNRWTNAHYDRINIAVPKGRKDAIQECARQRGESINAFIGRAILEAMERDGGAVPEIAGKPAETARGAGVVSLPSDTPEAAQMAAKAAGSGSPDKVTAAESLFRIMGDLGEVDLDESRGERLGVVCLPPDTLKTVQDATQTTGESFLEFVGRAVTTQAKRDKTSLAMGINPATGGKLEKEA